MEIISKYKIGDVIQAKYTWTIAEIRFDKNGLYYRITRPYGKNYTEQYCSEKQLTDILQPKFIRAGIPA